MFSMQLSFCHHSSTLVMQLNWVHRKEESILKSIPRRTQIRMTSILYWLVYCKQTRSRYLGCHDCFYCVAVMKKASGIFSLLFVAVKNEIATIFLVVTLWFLVWNRKIFTLQFWLYSYYVFFFQGGELHKIIKACVRYFPLFLKNKCISLLFRTKYIEKKFNLQLFFLPTASQTFILSIQGYHALPASTKLLI